MPAAPMFSSTWATEDVPGIGSSAGERRKPGRRELGRRRVVLLGDGVEGAAGSCLRPAARPARRAGRRGAPAGRSGAVGRGRSAPNRGDAGSLDLLTQVPRAAHRQPTCRGPAASGALGGDDRVVRVGVQCLADELLGCERAVGVVGSMKVTPSATGGGGTTDVLRDQQVVAAETESAGALAGAISSAGDIRPAAPAATARRTNGSCTHPSRTNAARSLDRPPYLTVNAVPHRRPGEPTADHVQRGTPLLDRRLVPLRRKRPQSGRGIRRLRPPHPGVALQLHVPRIQPLQPPSQ